MGIGQIRRHIGDANLAGNKLTECYVVLAVILINDTYVANPYQWPSLIRIFVMPECIFSEYTTQNMYQLRYEIVHSVTKL